ncbi:hypothetical protein Hanom_Chr02g00154871 [Helianthus anomalus]
MVADQVGCLKKALGTRHSHLWGVGQVLKSATLELFPNVNRMYRMSVGEDNKKLMRSCENIMRL